jgi:hypothetical protein
MCRRGVLVLRLLSGRTTNIGARRWLTLEIFADCAGRIALLS